MHEIHTENKRNSGEKNRNEKESRRSWMFPRR